MSERQPPYTHGKTVRLRSGGAVMAVESCEWREAQGDWFVLCYWMTEANELRSGHVPSRVLTLHA